MLTGRRKAAFSTQIAADVLDQLRSCVVQLGGPERLTLSSFVENAVRHELHRLALTHNEGRPFTTEGRPHPGAPIRNA